MSNLIRPKILVRPDRENDPVRVPLADLIAQPQTQTFLTSDTAVSTAALGVKNTNGFSGSTLGMIGTPGNEGTEIKKITSVTAPSTLTTTIGTTFPHSSNTPIVLIPYDQVEFSYATTLTGSKTVLTTVNVAVDQTETRTTSTTSGYLFARFKNSDLGTFSGYSDGVPVGGYTTLMARTIIDKALRSINKETSETLTDEFAFGELNNCQMETLRELKRWSFMQNFNSNIGSSTTGGWLVAVPTDLDDQNTNKSIYNFRIGKRSNMTWVDKEKWNDIIADVASTTLKSSFIVGATSIVLTSSADFNSTGTITIGADSFTYTANNVSTGTLTVTATTVAHTIGETVFQGATLGTPTYWTTFGGNIYHYPLADSTIAPANYYLDYYKSLTQINSDTDLTIIPDPLIPQYYLEWKFMKKLNNGGEDNNSLAAMNNYITRREKLKQKEVLGTSYVLKPRFNDFSRQMRGLDDTDKATKLAQFPNI